MKKILLSAIATYLVFAFTSCSNETESLADSLNSAKLTVTLGEGTKATMTNPTTTGAGFLFQSGDVINWVSELGTTSYTYTGEDANSITFDMDIPGLEEGDVEGYFAVNFTDEVPYCFNASNSTQAQAGINSDCFFLSSFNQTLTQGSTSVSVDVATVGGVFAFQFKGTGDKVLKVELSGDDPWCNNAIFDGKTVTFEPVMSKLTTNVNVETSDDYDDQCVFIPVPSYTIVSPSVTIYANSGIYTYNLSETAVCTDGSVCLKNGQIKKIKLPLDESFSDIFEEYPYGKITLTAECISTNDPMQYVVGGSDTYGFKSNPDWFTAITSTQAEDRKARYGKAENMFDNDGSTSFHTNLDWGQLNTSWGQRSSNINSNREEKRYIQVTLPVALNKFDLEFTNSDSGAEAAGLELLVTADGNNWTKVAGTDFSKDFSAENSAEDVNMSGALITALRIQNTNADADWTYVASAFGIAELSISAVTKNLTDSSKVTGITLDQSEVLLSIGMPITLTPTVSPATAKIKDVVWFSSDPDVATVSNGVVESVTTEGTAIITAKTVDGGFTASCEVTCSDD